MSFDLQKILESKRALRRKLAPRPVAEKMRLLEVLRERQIAIQRRGIRAVALQEEPAPYRAKP